MESKETKSDKIGRLKALGGALKEAASEAVDAAADTGKAFVSDTKALIKGEYKAKKRDIKLPPMKVRRQEEAEKEAGI